MEGMVGFGNKAKLSNIYVGLYEIRQRICKVAYKLKLPSELVLVHTVSMLKKCIGDPKSILPIDGIVVKDNLSYEEVTIQILQKNSRS